MTLPPGVKITNGAKIAVSQRGYFTKFPDGNGGFVVHFTACRFASLAQALARAGIVGSLERKAPAPGMADNLVHQLQAAGDPTPQSGSTLAMAQRAIRLLMPDAPILFGTMTDAEVQEALAKGATIGIGMDCGKWPAKLKRFVGQGYNGGHFCAFDGVRVTADNVVQVAMTDHMYAPAKNIVPRWVNWTDVAPSMSRRPSTGEIIVTLAYEGAAQQQPADKVAELEAALVASRAAQADAEARALAADTKSAALGAALTQAQAQIDGLNTRIDGAREKAQATLDSLD